MKEPLIIFDTTLRDGEQSPGASMTAEEKVRIAKVLERMRVDVIEAGFPIASDGDFQAVQKVAQNIKESTVCALARANQGDVLRAAEAIKPAVSGRIHTFIATSPIHMQKKLNLSEDQVVENAIAAVKLARTHTDNVEFSPEDAGRSEFDFLCRIIEACIAAGAGTINIPDTVGYTMPEQFGALIERLINTIPNADKAIFSVHCHNDLGLAVANSLAAVMHGARQVECTINGLGERAGNTSLEEVVMAVRTRADRFPCETNIDTRQIVPASKLVSAITGFPVQPNKAIVGANAFAHEAGIHQDGVIKNRETYEIMRAEDVGWDSNRMVLGKHSGRNALGQRLHELGIDLADNVERDEIFKRFKNLADKKHEIYDDDLLALVSEISEPMLNDAYKLISLSISTCTGQPPKAIAIIDADGQTIEREATGSGPVDASFRAIEAALNCRFELVYYNVNSITVGTDAQGEVSVRISKDGVISNGHGSDTDIITASAKAYINAINRYPADQKAHPQFSRAV